MSESSLAPVKKMIGILELILLISAIFLYQNDDPE